MKNKQPIPICEHEYELQEIPVVSIHAGQNDRKIFDESALRSLADNIDREGLIQPITVRPVPTGFEIVAGERRFRAITLLSWETVTAIVRDLDDESASAIMLAENTGRADLNPIEEANAYESRFNKFGWANSVIAEKAGVSVSRVKSRRSLLLLHPDIQHLVQFGNMPIGHAEIMVPLDFDRQLMAMRIFVSGKKIPLKKFQEIVNELLAEQSQDSLFDLTTFYIEQQEAAREIVTRGAGAIVNIPTDNSLPPVIASSKDNTSTVIARYIKALVESGKEAEAAAVGTLYSALVKKNYMQISG